MSIENTNPGWTPNDIGKISKYLTEAMDEVLEAELKTSRMTADPNIVEGARQGKTIKLATARTSGAGDYSVSNGWPAGSGSLTWEDYTLEYDRGTSFLVDALDTEMTSSLASASVFANEFIRTKMVPEIDAVRIARASSAAIGAENTEAGALTSTNILGKIEDALDSVFTLTGKDSGRTIYVNSKLKSTLRKSTEFTRVKDVGNTGGKISTSFEMIDDDYVVWVPPTRMYSSVELGTGYTKGANAEDLNFLVCADRSAQGVVAYADMTVIPKGAHTRGNSDFFAYRIYHDCIVPKEQVGGIFVSTKAEVEYTLKYLKNSTDATGTMTAETYSAMAVATLKDSGFTLTGKEFDGWNTKADGTGTDYSAGDEAVMKTDLTLYAQWV